MRVDELLVPAARQQGRGCTPARASVIMNSARSRPTPSTGMGRDLFGVVGHRQVHVERVAVVSDGAAPAAAATVTGAALAGAAAASSALAHLAGGTVDRDHLAVAETRRGGAGADDGGHAAARGRRSRRGR